MGLKGLKRDIKEPSFKTSFGLNKTTNKVNLKFKVLIGKIVSKGKQYTLHKKVPIPNSKGVGGLAGYPILNLLDIYTFDKKVFQL